MTITVMRNGRKERVEIVRKVNQGLRTTHNRDGRFQKVWAIDGAGNIFRTTSRGQYRPVQSGETPPPALRRGL